MTTRTHRDLGDRVVDDLAEFVSEARESIADGVPLRLRAGDATYEPPSEQATTVLALLELLAAGGPVDITSLAEELTTGQAADLLGVSRPTVVALVDRGALPASRIGTHRRIRTTDVLAFREQARSDRHSALDELVSISDDLGLYDN